MSVPILSPVLPDLSDDYWRVDTSTDAVVAENGCRRHIDHEARVRLARLRRDLNGNEEGSA